MQYEVSVCVDVRAKGVLYLKDDVYASIAKCGGACNHSIGF